jgi:hypothetical protein
MHPPTPAPFYWHIPPCFSFNAVNVKPNLQIIADDVKCTHGCSVSDLEEEELFYLRCV